MCSARSDRMSISTVHMLGRTIFVLLIVLVINPAKRHHKFVEGIENFAVLCKFVNELPGDKQMIPGTPRANEAPRFQIR